METTTAKPDFVTEDDLDEMLDYLDDLRDSGVANAFGAGVYLRDEFFMEKRDASTVLYYWMATFGDRHPT